MQANGRFEGTTAANLKSPLILDASSHIDRSTGFKQK